MKGMYLYNKNTNRLHIQGFCHHTAKGGSGQFMSEEEVLTAIGHPFVMCKHCQREKDKLLRERGE